MKIEYFKNLKFIPLFISNKKKKIENTFKFQLFHSNFQYSLKNKKCF